MLGPRLVGTLLTLLLLTAPASATDRTFVGGTDSNNWAAAANWDPVGVPGPDDDVTLPSQPRIVSAVTARSASAPAGLVFYSGGHLTLTGGTSVWTGGFIDMHDAAQISILSGATLDARGENLQNRLGGAGGAPGLLQMNIAPGGTLTRSQGSGTADFGAPIVNQGTVSVSSGVLRVQGVLGTDQPGAFAPLTGGKLAVRQMKVTTGANGPGALRVDSGEPVRVEPLATFDVGAVEFSGGRLEVQGLGHADVLSGAGQNWGTGELIVGAPVTLGSGMSFRAGRTTFADDVTINSDIYPGCGATLRFEGTTTWNGGFIDHHDAAVIENAGTFIPAAAGNTLRTGGAGCASGPIEFRNLPGGTFSRPSGSGVVIGSRFVNDGGTVDLASGDLNVGPNSVLNSGLWNMHDGALSSGNAFTVAGGVLRSTGTIAAPVTQTGGVFAPGASPGLTTVTGTYDQQGGTLEVEIAGTDPAQYDRLQVNGQTNLAGKLQIVTLSPFTPALADTFTIVDSVGDLTGAFDEVLGAQLTGRRYFATYAAHQAVLALAEGSANTGKPTIAPAVARPGDTLTCSPGSWTASPTFAYGWRRDGVDVSTGQTYLVAEGDVGRSLVCRVTATNAGGAATADSEPLVPVPLAPAGTVTVTLPPAPSPTPAPTPVIEPAVIKPAQVFTLPSVRRCVSRRKFRIRVRQPKNVKLVSVTVLVNGRKVKTNRGSRVTAPVDLRGLPKGRFRVEVRAVTSTGKKIRDKRAYRTCAPKKKS